MQKHQWRQHGIVHFKSRPPLPPCGGQLPPPPPSMGSALSSQANSGTATPTIAPHTTNLGVVGAEGALYNSLVDRIKAHGLESLQESSRGLMDGPARLPMLPPQQQQHASRPRSFTAGQPEDLSARFHERRAVSPSPVRQPSPPPLPQPQYQQPLPQLPQPAMQHHMVSIYRESQLQHLQQRSRSSPPPPSVPVVQLQRQQQEVTLHKESDLARSYEQQQPESAAARFAAFIAEHRRQQEESRRNEEQQQDIPQDFSRHHQEEVDREEEILVQPPSGSPANTRLLTTLLPRPISPMSPDQGETAPAPTVEVDVETQEEEAEEIQIETGHFEAPVPAPASKEEDEEEAKQHHPLNMKKMLARAYEAEQQLIIAKEKAEEDEQGASPDPTEEPQHAEDQQSTAKELVECQCKSCGNVFIVLDPYNFRCNQCGAKYTSLPTHMIADPLQCIGCTEVFPHKLALKAHQTGGAEKERPFKCCKCGYGFRQKAHLQKHQWRIHRRKLDQESLVGGGQQQPKDVATITIQDIIDHGVERSLNDRTPSSPGSPNPSQPLDLSPTKSLLLSSPPSSSYSITSSSSNLQELVGAIPNQRFASAPKAINPLLDNHKPASLTLPGTSHQPEVSQAMKRQRTTEPPVNGSGSHLTLPPIAGLLQKPSANSYQGLTLRISEDRAKTTSALSPHPPSQLSPNSFKHSAWLNRHQDDGKRPQTDVSDVRDLTKTPTVTEAGDIVRNDLLRAKLEAQTTQDIRTV